MKLSPLTQEILRNLSGVATDEKCCPLVVYPGNKLWAISCSTSIVGYAEVAEEFPCHFAIYDLRSFIAALSIFENPDVQFEDWQIILTDASGKEMHFPTCDPDAIKSPHDKMNPHQIADLFERTEEEGDKVEFELSWSSIQNAQKAAAVLAGFDKEFYYVINSDRKGHVRFGCADGRGTPNKTFFTEVGKSPVRDFRVFANRDTFVKLLNRDYQVRAMENIILMKSNDITYFVAAAAVGEGD
jgi:hypothetical protein